MPKKYLPILFSNLLYEMGQNFLYIKYEYLQFYQNLCYRTPNRVYHIFCNYSTTLYVRRLILANMFFCTGSGSDPTKKPDMDLIFLKICIRIQRNTRIRIRNTSSSIFIYAILAYVEGFHV